MTTEQPPGTPPGPAPSAAPSAAPTPPASGDQAPQPSAPGSPDARPQGTGSTGVRPSGPPGSRPGGPPGGRPGGGVGGYRGGGQGGGQGGPRGAPRRGGRPRYYARRKLCAFCVDHVKYIDYKDVEKFRRFITDRYKIESRRKTGACAKHQRGLSSAIKRARHLALLPFSPEHAVRGGVFQR